MPYFFFNFFYQTSVITEQVVLRHGYLYESQQRWQRTMIRSPIMLYYLF